MYDVGREPISGVTDFPHSLGYSAYLYYIQQAAAGVTKPYRPHGCRAPGADPVIVTPIAIAACCIMMTPIRSHEEAQG